MLSIHDSITPSSQVQTLHEFKTHISDLVSYQWTKLNQREDQHNKNGQSQISIIALDFERMEALTGICVQIHMYKKDQKGWGDSNPLK